MRIAILTTGTRGDVQPFVALGAALRRLGHAVTMTAPLDSAAFVAAGDMNGVQLPFSAHEVFASELGRRFLKTGNMLALLKALNELDVTHRDALVDAFARAGEGAEIILAHPLAIGAALVLAQVSKARVVRAYLGPTTPTRHFPTPLLDVGSLGPLNRLSHTAVLAAASRGGMKTTRALAARLGVAAPRGNIINIAERERGLTLHLYSAVLQPRPDDWPAHHVVTGSPMLDAETRAKMGEHSSPAGLDAWFDHGAPPVYFGFGSMPVEEPERMLALIEEVSVALDVRALVGAKWTAPSSNVASRTFVAPAFDHDTILPRCRAAVHHGGAGSTYTASRALACPPSCVTSLWINRSGRAD